MDALPLKRMGPWLAAVACALAAVLAFSLIMLAPRRELWLRVRAPSAASLGRPYVLSLRLSTPVSGTFLHADIHGRTRDGRDMGFIAQAPVQSVREGIHDYEFHIMVPQDGELAAVIGIIYLSASGTWDTRLSQTRLDPARIQATADPLPAPRPQVPHSVSEAAPRVRADYGPLRGFQCLVWLAASLASFFSKGRKGKRAMGAGAACACAAAWTVLRPDLAISAALRAALAASGGYSARHPSQTLAALAVIALWAGFLAYSAILGAGKAEAGAGSLFRIGYSGFVGVQALRIVSIHELDAFLAVPLGAIQLGQAAEAFAAALALSGALVAAVRGYSRMRSSR
jgi:hypothetical protein